MYKYILRRLIWMIFIIVSVAVLIFTIMYFVPGDPASLMLGAEASQADLANLRAKLGIDRPYIIQLGNYLYDTFIRFDLGTSYNSNMPVINELILRVPRTVLLGLLTIIVSGVIGIPLGIVCAIRQNSAIDRSLLVASMVGVSIPNFWLALMMIVMFSVNLHWLPARGIGGPEYWVLPVVASCVGSIAMNARQSRAAVLETIREDFVTTARAKGVKEHNVIYKHMLPNALIPVVATLGGQLAMAIAGTVVIERVFSFPGIGSYMIDAISNRDYPVVRSCVLLLAVFAALANLLVDIVYAYLDPRIKAQYISYASKKGAH